MVISVLGQREFQNPVVGGRDIRLDILAKDSTGKHYNIEVQKRSEGEHVRRARFNSSIMDSRMLKRRVLKKQNAPYFVNIKYELMFVFCVDKNKGI